MERTEDSTQISGREGSGNRSGPWLTASAVLVCVLPILLMWDLMRTLFALVLTNETYSHLPLIPLVCAFLIYTERETVFAKASRGWRAGSFLLAAGAICLLLVRVNVWQLPLSSRLSLLSLGIVLVWIGAFVVLFGVHASRTALFPLLFLLFAVPIPEFMLSKIVFFLQKESADATEAIFRLIGFPFLRRDFDFMLPTVTIRVAEECSGIRSTLALLITTVLAAHSFLKSNLRMLTLCAFVFPIAILKNGVRIATLSYLAVYVDRDFLFGNLHRRGGVVFFILGLLMMALLLVLLQRFDRTRKSQEPGLTAT
jgi:exosortase